MIQRDRADQSPGAGGSYTKSTLTAFGLPDF
jgi:hypothetical protein